VSVYWTVDAARFEFCRIVYDLRLMGLVENRCVLWTVDMTGPDFVNQYRRQYQSAEYSR
jgi:hypothetical protein